MLDATMLRPDSKGRVGLRSLTLRLEERFNVGSISGYEASLTEDGKRLAAHRVHQRAGIGGILLADALQRAYRAAQAVPVQAVVVHAKDDQAARFYQAHGLQPFPDHPHHLYIPMGSIAPLVA